HHPMTPSPLGGDIFALGNRPARGGRSRRAETRAQRAPAAWLPQKSHLWSEGVALPKADPLRAQDCPAPGARRAQSHRPMGALPPLCAILKREKVIPPAPSPQGTAGSTTCAPHLVIRRRLENLRHSPPLPLAASLRH